MVESDGTSPDTAIRKWGEEFFRQYSADYKIRFYIDLAEKQLAAAEDQQIQNDMREMIGCGKAALTAAAIKNVDSLLENYETIHRIRAKWSLKLLEEAKKKKQKKQSSTGGKKSIRGPTRPLRIVLDAICAEIGRDNEKYVRAWWAKQDSNTASGGVTWEHEINFDTVEEKPVYHFVFGGKPMTASKVDIQNILSEIRRKKRKSQK